ncbi:PE-PPE domain-containing protein [Nocardia alba]|uniref:PE-PPE domain-containing protein n=1 Tax=Nocardia alba TaxID=225051 RepID=A0A4R1FXE1_9NOCA|nr:PE-PPE domain-containing protein [Nocardia alba]TCJ97448.1 PE-PPE domain-containing protein [Nocardia alba]
MTQASKKYIADSPAVAAGFGGHHRWRTAVRDGVSVAVLTTLGLSWFKAQAFGTVALATTALIVPGTGTSDPAVAHNFESNAYQNFIDPGARGCTDNDCPGVTFVPVPYDAALWPVISSKGPDASSAKWDASVLDGVRNLDTVTTRVLDSDPDGAIVIFGYSQGATVSSTEKAAASGLAQADKDRLSFVLIANPNRPNGGIIERPVRFGHLPIADIGFGPPTPTDTGIRTTDVAMQYDGIADFPAYPLNVLATTNAVLGTLLIHPSYLQPKGDGAGSQPKTGATIYGYPNLSDFLAQQNCATHPENCQHHGDTIYFSLPNPKGTLPLLYPLRALGKHTNNSAVTEPAAALLEPTLRVLIETGYDRMDYSTPTPWRFDQPLNPDKTARLPAELPLAIEQGIADAAAAIENPSHHADRTLPLDAIVANVEDLLPPNPATPLVRALLTPTG